MDNSLATLVESPSHLSKTSSTSSVGAKRVYPPLESLPIYSSDKLAERIKETNWVALSDKSIFSAELSKLNEGGRMREGRMWMTPLDARISGVDGEVLLTVIMNGEEEEISRCSPEIASTTKVSNR